MFFYKIYCLNVESDLEFEWFVESDNSNADVRISRTAFDDKIISECPDYQVVMDKTIGWAKTPHYILKAENGRSIEYKVLTDSLDYQIQMGIMGVGLAMIAIQRGMIPMHCSAIRKDNQAMLICGTSGSGKSTTAAELLKSGWQLMADDVAWLEFRGSKTYVKPAYPGQKLCKVVAKEKNYELDKELYIDEDRDKYLVRYDKKFNAEECELTNVMCLDVSNDSNEVKLSRMTGIEAYYSISSNLFITFSMKNSLLGPEIGKRCLKVAASTNIYKVTRPSTGDTVKKIVELIEKAVK